MEKTPRRRSVSRMLTGIVIMTIVLQAHSPADDTKRPTERLVFKANDTQRCLKCHNMENFAFRHTLSYGEHLHDFSVNADTFQASVHGSIACQQCHTDITEYPHPFVEERARVSCGADCHATDSSGKTFSHQVVFGEFQSSVHRKGLTRENQDSPNCTTCHGSGNPHGIQKAKQAVAIREKMALCVSCHANQAMMEKNLVDPNAVSSYKRSFHYKAIRFGETNTAVCQDCHTVHHILPKDSASSSISTANISNTCGQQKCHPGAAMNFSMSGANHLALRIEREPILWWLEKFFVILTAGTLAMLIVGILLDIQRKFGWVILFGKSVRKALAGAQRIGEISKLALRFSKRILLD